MIIVRAPGLVMLDNLCALPRVNFITTLDHRSASTGAVCVKLRAECFKSGAHATYRSILGLFALTA